MLFPASPARAQSDQEQGEYGATGPPAVPFDSTGATIIDRLGVRPSYSSTVDINKTALQWSQSLQMKRDLGPARLENNWSIGRNRNSTQRNYELHDGKTDARFSYQLSGRGGLSTGGRLDLRRTLSESDISRTVRNSDQFNWFLSAGAPGELWSSLLGLEAGVLAWSVSASLGRTSNTDVQRTLQDDFKTGTVELARSDSTRAEGGTRELDSQFSLTAGRAWKLDVSGQVDSGRLDSRTRQIRRDTQADTVKVDTLQSSPSRNRSKRMAFTAAWSPKPTTRVALSGQFLRRFEESYSARVDRTDETRGLDQKVGLQLKATPFWGIAFDLNAETSRADLSYLLNRTQGQGRRREAISGNVRFVFGPRFGPLHRTESTTDLRWDDADNTFQTQKDFRGRQFYLSQQFRRPISQRLALVTKGEGNINQSFYQDRSQDRDELRLLGDVTLGYRPGPSWDTRISGQLLKRKSLSIPSRSSASSYTTNSYQIGGEVNCQATPFLKVSQKYGFTADYSFYNFDENRNYLARLTEVRTGLQSKVGERASLDLAHVWNVRDSGRYGRTEEIGPRWYTKQLKEKHQVLEASTAYQFGEGLRLSARQRYEVRESTKLDTRSTSRQPDRLEFTGRMDLNHQFSPDFNVSAQVERTQSTLERNFWRVNARVNRVF